MTRTECPIRPCPPVSKAGHARTIAALTASLLLSACSATPDLLSSSLVTKPTETGSAATPTSDTDTAPQTELQKATLYWGNEFAKKPTDLKAALSYAKDLKAMGEKQKALAVLQQASVFHNTDRELAGEYGRLALELDQVGVANQLLAVADDPTKPDWRVISARGTVLAKQGKYSDAIPFYERALTLSQNNPTVMNNLAMANAMMGDPKKAEDILRQAMSVEGATPKIRENLALVLGLQGRYDESKAVAASVLNTEVASANTAYLKDLVKLEPKIAMPDATSFASNTTVQPTSPPHFAQSTRARPSAPVADSSWQTTVGETASVTKVNAAAQ